jgi:hypothetical protein
MDNESHSIKYETLMYINAFCPDRKLSGSWIVEATFREIAYTCIFCCPVPLYTGTRENNKETGMNDGIIRGKDRVVLVAGELVLIS